MSDTASGTDSVITTVITTTSVSLTTSPTTTIIVTDTSTSTPDPAPAPATTTSIVTEPTSTTVVPPTTASVIDVTQTTTITPEQTPTTATTPTSPSVVVVTSTQPGDTSVTRTSTDTANKTTRTSSTASALSASGNGTGGGGGLSSGGKIAIAVIIPIVVIAAAFLIGFFLWRKRKARKTNEELRKNEMAEYGFNPNDSTLVGTGGAYTDNVSEAQEDNSGYRGWGATSSNRKVSTTLGSNGKPASNGLAMSESSSQPGGYHGSPNAPSDAYSTDPLMNGHPESGDGVGALGAGAGLNRNRSGAAGVRRGPSNASSTYSEGHASELSSDNQSVPGPYYQEEVPYNIYNDAAPSHGPYGDGSYGGVNNQPVIRDVQARRNTRIERAPTFPQTQGGISQNF